MCSCFVVHDQVHHGRLSAGDICHHLKTLWGQLSCDLHLIKSYFTFNSKWKKIEQNDDSALLRLLGSRGQLGKGGGSRFIHGCDAPSEWKIGLGSGESAGGQGRSSRPFVTVLEERADDEWYLSSCSFVLLGRGVKMNDSVLFYF